MKHFLLFTISLILFSNTTIAQDFDTQLEKLAEGIATNLDGKSKKKIAVWGFVTENGERSSLGNYLTEDFSVYLTNFGDNIEIIDRNHLDVLLKEHQLNSEGYIDEETAKQLGKIIAVDAIITGTYTVLNSTVKVRAKVLDTETALQIAASMANLPLDENIASYLGVSVNGGNSTNRGFNRSLNSNETVNNPEKVDSECSKKRTGDFCFANSLNEKIIVYIIYWPAMETKSVGSKRKTSIILEPKESKCIYSIPERPFSFYIATWKNFTDSDKLRGFEYLMARANFFKFLKDKGELKTETCKSKTYNIK